MAITAKIGNPNRIVGSVSQGSQPQVNRVSIPAAAKSTQITDFDLTGIEDGAFLQYSSEDKVFRPTTTISGAAF